MRPPSRTSRAVPKRALGGVFVPALPPLSIRGQQTLCVDLTDPALLESPRLGELPDREPEQDLVIEHDLTRPLEAVPHV